MRPISGMVYGTVIDERMIFPELLKPSDIMEYPYTPGKVCIRIRQGYPMGQFLYDPAHPDGMLILQHDAGITTIKIPDIRSKTPDDAVTIYIHAPAPS